VDRKQHPKRQPPVIISSLSSRFHLPTVPACRDTASERADHSFKASNLGYFCVRASMRSPVPLVRHAAPDRPCVASLITSQCASTVFVDGSAFGAYLSHVQVRERPGRALATDPALCMSPPSHVRSLPVFVSASLLAEFPVMLKTLVSHSGRETSSTRRLVGDADLRGPRATIGLAVRSPSVSLVLTRQIHLQSHNTTHLLISYLSLSSVN